MSDELAKRDEGHLHLLTGGEMRSRIAAYDWSETTLGPASTWPQSLKSAVEIMLTSRYPMLVWWGPELIQFYNDAYIPVLGQRHPWGLGQPAAACWAEAWPFVGALADAVIDQGVSTWSEQLEMVMTRNGFPEEVYMTFSYSPILDEAGAIGGLFCACTEDTQRVLGDRRMAALGMLADRTASAKTIEEACKATSGVLAGLARDLPFTLLYLLDEEQRTGRLAGHTGLEAETPASPLHVHLGEADEPWPFSAVLMQGTSVEVPNLSAAAPEEGLPSPWPEPPREAVVLPLARSGRAGLAGFLVAGLSPRLVFDEGYRTFLDLLARHVATALTAARAYEEERTRAEALAELDRAKTAFFSNVSHEFRTPLTLMLGPLDELLAHPDDLDPATAERVGLARRSAQRLLKLVNTLLDFSRIEAGRAEASYEATDLAQLTADLSSNFRSATERAGLSLVVEAEPLGEPVFVDRDMWEKIVLNLISNAFKFTHEGEIRVTVRPMADRKGAELEVRDTGIGIAAHELPHLFERFHQVEGARGRSFEGSGIGLALVQELVRLHGGTIEVTSEVDRGSCFIVRLPFGTAHLPRGRAGSAKARTSTAIRAGAFVEEALGWLPAVNGSGENRFPDGSSAGSGRVLLADDNADMRAYVERLLTGHGFSVEAVAHGDAALAAARRRPPDLILSDVMMPGIDGLELLARLRADPELKDVPVVLLSARAGEEARAEAMEAGADDYLIKPFAPRELVARISANINLARERRETLLRESEKRYRTLFEAIDEGFCVVEVIFDSDGHPADYRFLEINPAFEEQTGLIDAVGKRMRELAPDHEEFWFEAYGRIARTGNPERFEHRANALGRWYDVYAFRIGTPLQNRVAILFRDVAERKRTEAALREGEERLRAAFSISTVGVLFWSPDGRLTDANDAFLQMSGFEREEALGKTWQDFTPEEFHAASTKFLEEIETTGEGTPYEKQYFRKNGSRWWGLFAGHRLQDGFVEFVLDVTRQHEAQDALHQREEQLRLIVESARDYAIFTVDREHRVTQWMAGAEAVFGWTREEMEGHSADVLYTPEDLASAQPEKEIACALAEGKALDVRWHTHKDGRKVFIDGLVVPLQDGGGADQGFLKIGQDVTHRRSAEQALQESEERFRQFGEASSDLLWIRNAETLSFEYVSPAFTKLYGVAREQILKGNDVKAWLELIHPDDREEAVAGLRSLRDGVPCNHEFRAVHPGGDIVWVHNTDFPILDETGRVQRIAGIAQDVTERKRAVELQSMLLAELQHRVRNILAVMRSIIRRSNDEERTTEDYVHHLEGRISALARTQVLLTRKPGAGVDMEELVRDELVAQAVSEDQISIRGPDVTLAPKAAEVLTLAIHELATNATKYGAFSRPEGRLRIEWEVSRRDGQDWLALDWVESGVPIVSSAPMRRGFGAELISRRIPYELKGHGRFELRPGGLSSEIEFPLMAGESILQTDGVTR